MGAPKSAVTKATEKIRREADDLDARRRHQIANQVIIINRLLDGATFEGEMERLADRLAKTQAEVDRLEHENSLLRAVASDPAGV